MPTSGWDEDPNVLVERTSQAGHLPDIDDEADPAEGQSTDLEIPPPLIAWSEGKPVLREQLEEREARKALIAIDDQLGRLQAF
eukprot:symbB.v1.2.022660.t1/scaffold2021.1/size93746/2